MLLGMLKGTMSRASKGRIAPAPQLRPLAQRVADSVVALPGVVAQAHWEIGSQTAVNGTDFYVDEHELGHIHLDGEAHIPVGADLARALIEKKLARRFRWSNSFVVVDTENYDGAMNMFRLRRAQIDGVGEVELLAQISHA